jgi:alkylhydroperoxidase family enzyme
MVRIEPLPIREWPEEMRGAMEALRPPNPRHPFPVLDETRPRAMNALGTLARHPALARAFHTFNGHILFASTISPRQRELLVLRVAVRRDAEYERRQHEVVGRVDAGLTEDEISRIAEGPDAPGWSPLDRALLRSVDELVRDGVIADDTWATLATELDTEQLMDVVFTVGAYETLAFAFRSFGIELDDDLRRGAT